MLTAIGDSLSIWLQFVTAQVPYYVEAIPMEVLAAASAAGSVLFGLRVARTLASPRLPRGAVASWGAFMIPSKLLLGLLRDQVNPAMRARALNRLTREAKKRIIKRQCQICSQRLQRGQCPHCGKSGAATQREYLELVRYVILETLPLLAQRNAMTLEAYYRGERTD